jgi:hypothetical protein
MMIKGGIRIGGLSRIAGFDADAAAYFDRAGVTDATAKSQISAFVVGIKDLGLWSNIVSWPLRSSQNKGSGTTAYSLGGLGTFDGTLTNGPTWGTDGITFDGTNDYIVTSLEANNYPSGLSQMVALNPSSTTGVFSMFFGDEGSNPGEAATMIRKFTANDAQSVTDFTGGSVNAQVSMTYDTWHMIHSRISAPSIFLSVDTNNETSTTGSGTFSPSGSNVDRVGFGARNKLTTPEFFAKMTASFGCFISSATSSATMQSVKSLYKTTLGTGLGLP